MGRSDGTPNRLRTPASWLLDTSARGRNIWGSTLSGSACHACGGDAKALHEEACGVARTGQDRLWLLVDPALQALPAGEQRRRVRIGSDGPASRPPGCPGSRRRAGCVRPAEGNARPTPGRCQAVRPRGGRHGSPGAGRREIAARPTGLSARAMRLAAVCAVRIPRASSQCGAKAPGAMSIGGRHRARLDK